ncbi:hypothetical protein E2320_006572, partial [Naja naja]
MPPDAAANPECALCQAYVRLKGLAVLAMGAVVASLRPPVDAIRKRLVVSQPVFPVEVGVMAIVIPPGPFVGLSAVELLSVRLPLLGREGHVVVVGERVTWGEEG